MGPFTTAANLAGTEKILRAMRKDKENLHKLLDFAADATIEVGRKFVENKIGIGLAEPTASLLSPKQFREFVIPYYVKVMDKWKEWGSHGSGFHICGDTTKLLETFLKWVSEASVSTVLLISLTQKKQSAINFLLWEMYPLWKS